LPVGRNSVVVADGIVVVVGGEDDGDCKVGQVIAAGRRRWNRRKQERVPSPRR